MAAFKLVARWFGACMLGLFSLVPLPGCSGGLALFSSCASIGGGMCMAIRPAIMTPMGMHPPPPALKRANMAQREGRKSQRT